MLRVLYISALLFLTRCLLSVGEVAADGYDDFVGFETEAQAYGTDIPNLKGLHKRYLYGPGS